MAGAKDGVPASWKLGASIYLAFATSIQGVLVGLSKNDSGRYDYNVATVPLLAEMLKIALSGTALMMVYIDPGREMKCTVGWGTLHFIIPSLIYVVNHNLTFVVLKFITPASYQLLGNLKIGTTALLCRMVLARRLSKLKWTAVLLLMIGTTVSQVQGQSADGSSYTVVGSQVTGYVLAIVMAFLSGGAGVYSELLLKRNDDNINWQNLQMYGWGVLVNGLRLTLGGKDGQSHVPGGILAGYDYRAWLIVINLGVSGLVVSFILKYVDNIAKVFSTGMAMFLTPLLSIVMFDLYPSFTLLLGACIASISVVLFYLIGPAQTVVDAKELLDAHEAMKAATKGEDAGESVGKGKAPEGHV